jgi:glyoxylase-like metal-dependent hydrolase (beta-lactamase superfamily II)
MGIRPSNLDFVVMSHLHTDHASGLKLVAEARRILVSAPELLDTKRYPVRYAARQWAGVALETFDFNESGIGPVGRSFDLFHDERIVLVNIPGHTNGLSAALIRNRGRFVLLFADGGYATRSWQQMIPPGTALDAGMAMRSLAWIADMSRSANCVESLANHDPDAIPHVITL